MANKKKVVKRSANASNRKFGMDNNTFLLIVGGGFVVIVLVMMLLGGMFTRDTDVMPTPSPVSMKAEQNENANIQVTSPEKDAVVARPVTIKGKARVFENRLSYRIKDSDGFVLVSASTTYTGENAEELSDFTITTNYLEPKGTQGTVEVFNASAKDGSDENLVSIPVMFK